MNSMIIMKHSSGTYRTKELEAAMMKTRASSSCGSAKGDSGGMQIRGCYDCSAEPAKPCLCSQYASY